MNWPKRGEIYWVALDPTVGSEINKQRPALVVSLDILNERRNTVVVIPLSSKGTSRPPLVVQLPSVDGQPNARIDRIRTVDKSRLKGHQGRLSGNDLKVVEENLRIVLGL